MLGHPQGGSTHSYAYTYSSLPFSSFTPAPRVLNVYQAFWPGDDHARSLCPYSWAAAGASFGGVIAVLILP